MTWPGDLEGGEFTGTGENCEVGRGGCGGCVGTSGRPGFGAVGTVTLGSRGLVEGAGRPVALNPQADAKPMTTTARTEAALTMMRPTVAAGNQLGIGEITDLISRRY